MFSWFRAAYENWKQSRLLKKHDVSTIEEYLRKIDPDFNRRGSTIGEVYSGYPYVTCIVPNGYVSDYHGTRPHFESLPEIIDWCAEHCTGKMRNDCGDVNLRGDIRDWQVDNVYPDARMFFAFQEERDLIMFKLMWS